MITAMGGGEEVHVFRHATGKLLTYPTRTPTRAPTNIPCEPTCRHNPACSAGKLGSSWRPLNRNSLLRGVLRFTNEDIYA